jgi:hypothetical protein
MAIPYVQSGDPLSAARQNRLIDGLNGLLRADQADVPVPPWAWVELTQPLSYTNQGGQCPHSDQAKTVWFLSGDSSYGGTQYSDDVSVYHPAALRDSTGDYVGLPLLRSGDRVWCRWNAQSGRWEIAGDLGRYSYRALLGADLDAGGSSQAEIWQIDSNGNDAGTAVSVTVYDWFLQPDQTIPAGTKIKIEWFADDGRFYVTNAECSAAGSNPCSTGD